VHAHVEGATCNSAASGAGAGAGAESATPGLPPCPADAYRVSAGFAAAAADAFGPPWTDALFGALSDVVRLRLAYVQKPDGTNLLPLPAPPAPIKPGTAAGKAAVAAGDGGATSADALPAAAAAAADGGAAAASPVAAAATAAADAPQAETADGTPAAGHGAGEEL
jgi:hypothetical protein